MNKEEKAMKIKVNGKEQVINADSKSIAELLSILKVENPQMVSVQFNGEFVSNNDRQTTYVKDNDEVDFLYFMGGGQGDLDQSRRVI